MLQLTPSCTMVVTKPCSLSSLTVATDSNNGTAVKSLTFPAGFSVKQYPIEHASDYYKMFGINHGMGEKDVDALLHTSYLSFDEIEIVIPGRFMWATGIFA